MRRKDWTLLVIAAARGESVSPVQLQKALFLIAENLTPGQRGTTSFYHFVAYDYGPFDQTAYADAEVLEREGLIRIYSQPYRYRVYVSTPTGSNRAEVLRQELAVEVVEYLDRVVDWVRSLSFNDLVRAIYRSYPQMKVNSVFAE